MIGLGSDKKENVWRKTILFTVKLAVYDSVKMMKYTVKCEKQELFIGFNPFQTIYALMFRIRKCHELRTFWRNFLALKTAVA